MSFTHILFSGGGVKGIAFIGVLKTLSEQGLLGNVTSVSGVSAGAIVALLFVLGYTPEQMESIAIDCDMITLGDIQIQGILKNYGLDTGNGITAFLESLVESVGYSKDITFRQLYKKTGKKFTCYAANIRTHALVAFDYITTPNLKVLNAIRMSFGIPLVFTAKRYKGDMYVDGGLIDSFPIHLCDPECTLGIRLADSTEHLEVSGITDYLYRIVRCVIETRHRAHNRAEYARCVIDIHTNVMPLKFDLTKEEKLKLIAIGYNSKVQV
ncbi:hypothetical protein EB118_12240 [bacterium]|nr:hypothetical protein [bacterium]NDC93793.1 hypothetical protein [bacterium]NDD84933.1 hypothetical protein [bacterium]NDG30827.1 hypothetical protein [bacterium]